MQIFIQDLCHDVQTAGRGIAIKQNAQSDADNKDVTQNIQLLTAGERSVCRKNLFKQCQKQWQQNAGIDGLRSKFFSAGEKADDEQ